MLGVGSFGYVGSRGSVKVVMVVVKWWLGVGGLGDGMGGVEGESGGVGVVVVGVGLEVVVVVMMDVRWW